MEALKSSIVHHTASIAEQIAKGRISASAHPILTNMVAEAKNLVSTEFRELAKELIESSAGKRDLADIVKSIEQFRLLQETQIVALELDLANAAPPIVESSPSTTTRVVTETPRARKIEMEKCKVPTFDGDTIAYP